MKKEPIYARNERVEFKDANDIFHIGYVKSSSLIRMGLFRKRWVYNICETEPKLAIRKVYTVPESNIFGIVIPKEKTNRKTNSINK